MKLIERNRCAVSGAEDLEHLHTFPRFPVFMGCLEQPEADDLRQDMSWWISRGSGLIQLRQLLPLEVLYAESHGSGAIGASWQQHHRALAGFLSQAAPSAVLELGGGHGILSREYHRLAAIPWTILEANPAPVEGCAARFIKGIFDENFSCPEDVDTLVHSHLFEHIYEPNRFMRQIAACLKPGQHLVFSLPNMRVMLERGYTNCVNFEHTLCLTEPHVEFLLAGHGFRLLRREYFLDDHSIFYDAVRDPGVAAQALPGDLYARNRGLYLDYLRQHRELVAAVNRGLRQAQGPAYLFGAHVQAQYLIAFGLDLSRIVAILDNDPGKQGKRLYGCGKRVYSPALLETVDNPLVILRAGTFTEEITRQIASLNPSTRFLP